MPYVDWPAFRLRPAGRQHEIRRLTDRSMCLQMCKLAEPEKLIFTKRDTRSSIIFFSYQLTSVAFFLNRLTVSLKAYSANFFYNFFFFFFDSSKLRSRQLSALQTAFLFATTTFPDFLCPNCWAGRPTRPNDRLGLNTTTRS